ncbi:uncharacterized protein LOC124157574 [Ischnura elegans]|uniref:uncharacterized protein LOC124157574 n=1 Tax=Ischnura elegans TaxID=197161 RepID=UPI001ED89E7B|nr:uncharacterized protein LOC124157574 [Ischnura elegans]
MGITGLIPFLEKASVPINIRQYKGQTVAVDAYGWIHRGIFSCAEKIARGEKCDMYVTYCLKYVNMLISHDIKPILVFDGRYLPAKAATEKKRRQSREQNRTKAAELLRQGRTAEARRCLRSSVDVGPEMAVAVARACRSVGADCIVAPFEADAQLAYLNRSGLATAVITEDSDLILFGCTRVIFKLDLVGCGLEVTQDRIHLAMGVSPERFSMDRFRQMCVLSGCDYLPSLPGIGLAKAKKFVNSTSSPDISQALSKLPSATGLYNLEVSEEYIKEFAKADATFLYQVVYDPVKRAAVPLNEPSPSSLHLDLAEKIIGKPHSPETEYQLALGNLSPFSLKVIDDFNPDGPKGPCGGGIGKNGPPKRRWKSIWAKNFTPWGDCKAFSSRDALMEVDRDSTFGKEAVMRVGFFQSQEIKDTPVRRSPRKRKHPVNVEEECGLKDGCTREDLDIIYGSPSPKKRRKTTLIPGRSKNCLDSLDDGNSMVVAEIIRPEDSGNRKLKQKLFRQSRGISPVKSDFSPDPSKESQNLQDEPVEDVQNSSQQNVQPVLESVDLNSVKSDVKNGEHCGGGDEGSYPKSPVLERRKSLNPFAKPKGSSPDLKYHEKSFLKSPSLFSKLNRNESALSSNTIVKSRYFVSSPPKEFVVPKEEPVPNRSPILERLSCDNSLTAENSEEDAMNSGPTESKNIDFVGTYVESDVKLSSPIKSNEKVILVSPRKPNNPFSVESECVNNSMMRNEKSPALKTGSHVEDASFTDKFNGDKEFSEPRKGLFNWSSLKDKFAYLSSIQDSVESNSSPNANDKWSSKEDQRRDSVGNTPRPTPTRGRGRGQNCRRPGLGRSSTPKGKQVLGKANDSQQSLLSRFGFQKK